MKRFLFCVISVFLFSCVSSPRSDSFRDDEYRSYFSESFTFRSYEARFEEEEFSLSEYEISLIVHVLSHTPELNIHRIWNQNKNRVYLSGDGLREVVYDKNGNLVTSPPNMGSPNYFYYVTHPLEHFSHDILPWIYWGNTPKDPTTVELRKIYYIRDLGIGIQSLFFGFKREQTLYSEFSNENRKVLLFFHYLLFNDEHALKPTEENIRKMKRDSRLYYQYYNKVKSLLKLI